MWQNNLNLGPNKQLTDIQENFADSEESDKLEAVKEEDAATLSQQNTDRMNNSYAPEATIVQPDNLSEHSGRKDIMMMDSTDSLDAEKSNDSRRLVFQLHPAMAIPN